MTVTEVTGVTKISGSCHFLTDKIGPRREQWFP